MGAKSRSDVMSAQHGDVPSTLVLPFQLGVLPWTPVHWETADGRVHSLTGPNSRRPLKTASAPGG